MATPRLTAFDALVVALTEGQQADAHRQAPERSALTIYHRRGGRETRGNPRVWRGITLSSHVALPARPAQREPVKAPRFTCLVLLFLSACQDEQEPVQAQRF